MKSIRILPYSKTSSTARKLARLVNGLRVRLNGVFKPRGKHLVINWGSPRVPVWWKAGLNHPSIVYKSSYKDIALPRLKEMGVSVPDFTNDINKAQQWVNEGKVVVGRSVLNGHAGIGCRIYKDDQRPNVDQLPLYTLHVRHKDEYRVHVFNGAVITFAKKLKRRGFVDVNPWIRSYANGWVFCRDGVQLPDGVDVLAIAAVKALGLDFGAVDIGYRLKEKKGYVFEVNTAPGLMGSTIGFYADALLNEARQ